jgi:hypothetical protein
MSGPVAAPPRGLLARTWRPLVGAAVGALGGWLYWYFIGCRSGTCLISSNVWISTGYWGVVGGIALMPWATPRQPASGGDEAGPG